jgi:hypothetical protein
MFAQIRIQIFDLMQKIHVAAIIRLRFSHTGEYLLRIASNYLAKPFTRLWSQLILGSF